MPTAIGVAVSLLFIGAGCGQQAATNTAANVQAEVNVNASAPASTSATGALGVNAATNGAVSANVAPTPATPPAPAPDNAPDGTDALPMPPREISVTAKQWSFSPAEIRVKQDERIRLRITSLDVAHGFFAPGLHLEAKLEPGKTATLEFTADQKGTFDFHCDVFCGQGHADMDGVIIVE